MKKTKAQLNGFAEKISIIMADALPAKADHLSNFLPTEISSRIIANVGLVRDKAELRDQILLVLSDYREHLATGKRLASEGTRISLAKRIIEEM